MTTKELFMESKKEAGGGSETILGDPNDGKDKGLRFVCNKKF